MCLFPITIRTHPKDKPSDIVTVSCGNCLECLQARSREWAFRIVDECRSYDQNCFITLTYNNDNLPDDNSVSRREVQLFMKRLRKRLSPLKVRFFACGEYGSHYSRPHYHIIIFGWFPSDAVFFQRKDGVELYRSKTIESVWMKGYSTVGNVTYESALYCAKYMNKLEFRHTKTLTPPFVQMSNRPGIGYNSVYRCDSNSDKIYLNGKWIKIPRYYLKVMERDGIYVDGIKERRRLQGEMVAKTVDLDKKRKRYYEKFLAKKLPPS